MNIVYSYNKTGYDAEFWRSEITAASTEEIKFFPFNHDRYLSPRAYQRAQQLDDLYWAKCPQLLRLYADFETFVSTNRADAIIVTNCPPYHPQFLLKLPVYRVLYNTDDPVTTYDRNVPYLHAYHHVFYYNPYYRPGKNMADFLADCGVVNADYVPLGLFDAMHDPAKAEEVLIHQRRDIDVIYIGAAHFSKLPTLAAVKKQLGRRFRLHGWFNWKRNLYFNTHFRGPGWVTAVPRTAYVSLYQRAKIGFNVGDPPGIYGVPNYRMYEVPANGALLICEGGEQVNTFYKVGEEVVAYDSVKDLLEKTEYYLAHDEERLKIALAGHRRVLRSYKFREITAGAAKLIERGMKMTGYCKESGGRRQSAIAGGSK